METASTRRKYRGTPKQSNSTRIPDTINGLFAFIARRRNLGEKISQIHRMCAILGAQIIAANGPPGLGGQYDTFLSQELARAIVDDVRGAARFCEGEGFAVVEVPAAVQEQLSRTEEELRQANLRLAHLEELLGALLQGGVALPLLSPRTTNGQGWATSGKAGAVGAGRHVRIETIDGSEAVAERLGLEDGFAL
jgi:hypothetical protein